MSFDLYIGIDYSGAQTPTSRLKGLRVYATQPKKMPKQITTASAPEGKHWNWSRKEVAEWLTDQLLGENRLIAGIDHGFSFPASYFERYSIPDWNTFLIDFRNHWPSDEDHTYVEFLREDNLRIGAIGELRLTETYTSSAKSVFKFDGQGSVGKSSHSGIPWLLHIRETVGDRIHFWPFDGWDFPENKSVIAEVYPSIFKNRFPREGRTPDEQDAYAVARWLEEKDREGILNQYLHPPLSDSKMKIAKKEGWILGIM